LSRVQIIVPGRTKSGGGTDSGSAESDYFEADRFAAELGQHLGVAVPVVEDAQDAVSPEGAILLFASEPSPWMCALEAPQRARLLSRVCLLQGQRAPAFLNDLAMHGLAGGVEAWLYRGWQMHPEKGNGYGLVGLRSVVERLGGECAGGPFSSERYCVFDNPRARSLTDSLAQYLRELDRAPTR
jgi:hypothetical protein